MASLSSLTTATLFADLQTLANAHHGCTASIVQHLAEVESRGAHLERGYSTLFKYCVEELRFSEDEAYRRVEAARLFRRFPVVCSYLQSGAVSLSVLIALKAHLTDTNHAELLAAVSMMSRRKAEEWLASRFPRSDVRESVRQLPSKTTVALSVSVPEVLPLPLPPTVPAPHRPRGPVPKVEPLSEERFAIHLTVNRSVKEQLELARALMRHQNPTGDLETVVSAAVRALIEQLEKKKLGVERDRRSSSIGKLESVTRNPSLRVSVVASAVTSTSAHISRATRRIVVARDGWGCSYVGPDGRRCECRDFLEFDHRRPKGMGGTGEAANVRLLCRAHNQFEAERVYGKPFVNDARKRYQREPRAVAAPGAEARKAGGSRERDRLERT
jgi:hypothetical protein